MDFILYLPILLFSVILHEFAHGYSAYRYGDDTAYLSGRLTLNPIAHIDPVGTVVLPFVCYLAGWPMIGWAKPVPVNPYRLRHPRADMPKVAFAGPLTNIILVIIAALLFKLSVVAGFTTKALTTVLLYTIMINLILAIFNLIPVPPLDGSKVLAGFLPDHLADKLMSLERYGMIIVMVLVFSGIFSKVVLPIFYMVLNIIFNLIGAR